MYCKTAYPKDKSLTTYVPWKAQFGQKIGKPQVVGSKYASIWSFTPNAVVEGIYSTCLYALDLQAICNCFLWAFFFHHSAPEYRNIHKSLFSESAFEVSRQYDVKLCFETKSTKLGVGHFMSISGHFFANYIYSIHKNEVLMIILKDPTCQNLSWIKSYNISHKFFYFLLFSIL